MIKINIIYNYKAWERCIFNPNKLIQSQSKKINKKFKRYKKNIIFFTILLSGNNEIKRLNKKFRKKNKSTDVLSFPFHNKKELNFQLRKEKEIYLGDIIINFHKVKNKKNKKEFKLELTKLWIHGFTHLFGYDHKKEKDFHNMENVEKKFISFLN
tara:strand:- start:1522 stop:1986 length:465 start_codon:yes stop_codon:yes gene_type:complete